MTRMTGPGCAVMCNLINTHTTTTTVPYPVHTPFVYLELSLYYPFFFGTIFAFSLYGEY